MNIYGIIAEYNPFHNGHLYHISETRAAGATHIVTVLGSSFTQRGDIALISKAARAEAAIRGGSDLVIELPLYWTMSPAQNFAFGAVSLLNSLGAVNGISFGSECGDTELLQKAAAAAESSSIKPELNRLLASGKTFAAARQQAVSSMFGENISAVLASPNNTLAAEYISAAERLHCNFNYFTVPRRGAAHDSDESGKYASASAIRQAALSGENHFLSLPDFSNDILSREISEGRVAALNKLECAIMCKLKLMSIDDLSAIPDISEGLENRIYAAARECSTYDGLCEKIKTKRYPLARIRRLILSAFLGLDNSFWMKKVPYIRVLGIGKNGTEILRKAKQTAKTPIIMKAAAAVDLGGESRKIMLKETAATEIFNMAVSAKCCNNNEYTNQIFKCMEEK